MSDEKKGTIQISLAAVPNRHIKGEAETAIVPGKVMIHFPTPTQNVSFSAEEARLLGKKLTDLAVEAEKTIEIEPPKAPPVKACVKCGKPLPSESDHRCDEHSGNGGEA